MREEEGRTALCSMADAHAAVRPRAARSGVRPSWPPDRTDARPTRPIQRLRLRPNGTGPGRPSARPGGRPECYRIPPTGPTDRTAPPLIVR